MQGLFSLIPLIIVFPFAGMLINVFFGRRLMPRSDSVAPGVIASLMAALAFVIAVLMFVGLLGQPQGTEVPLLTWFRLQAGDFTLAVPWTIKVDTLSSVMMLVVTGVGTLIHIYAIGYMQGDIDEQAAKRGLSPEEAYDLKRRRFPRFFAFLNLFLGSMLILVTANNYLMMFVGWELVGLCSYLLIGFWFDDPVAGITNSAAGKKAFIVNRVGDFGMLLAIMLIFWTFGTLTFDDVFARAECMQTAPQAECLTLSTAELHGEAVEGEHEAEGEGEPLSLSTPIAFGPLSVPLGTVVTIITLCLLLGATGKSAQIPLFVWLPDAMAGPTPVSALIHAATMVTAGIYMITRSNVLYAMAPVSGTVVALVGAATGFVAATIAVAQFDIKRVLAYSTISQLGFMVAAAGLGAYAAAIFHLATHAFFKALLFLSAGSVIHGMEHGHHATAHHGHGGHQDSHALDPQDMRNMGGLSKKMPLTTIVYIVGALALAGIPPLAGFWSKDEILLDASRENTAAYILLTVAAFFTAFYMGRQIFMVFFGRARTEAAAHAAESPAVMTTPLIVLAVLSAIGGVMNLPFEGFHHLGHWLAYSVVNIHIPAAGESFSLTVAGISTVLALAAIFLSFLLYGRKPLEEGQPDPLRTTGPVFTFLNRKWYWDELYAAVFVQPYTRMGDFLAATVDWRFWHDFVHDNILTAAFKGWAAILSKPIDMGVVDGAVNGVGRLISGSSNRLRRTQTGYVRNYALAVALGVVVILIYLAIRLLL
jgi:NADH-quinone oxidoreductase subunit L